VPTDDDVMCGVAPFVLLLLLLLLLLPLLLLLCCCCCCCCYGIVRVLFLPVRAMDGLYTSIEFRDGFCFVISYRTVPYLFVFYSCLLVLWSGKEGTRNSQRKLTPWLVRVPFVVKEPQDRKIEILPSS